MKYEKKYEKSMWMPPYEAFTSKKPNVSGMHEFSAKCYAYDQSTKGGFTQSVITVDVTDTHLSSSHFYTKISLICMLHHMQAMKSVNP